MRSNSLIFNFFSPVWVLLHFLLKVFMLYRKTDPSDLTIKRDIKHSTQNKAGTNVWLVVHEHKGDILLGF